MSDDLLESARKSFCLGYAVNLIHLEDRHEVKHGCAVLLPQLMLVSVSVPVLIPCACVSLSVETDCLLSGIWRSLFIRRSALLTGAESYGTLCWANAWSFQTASR